MLDATLRSDQAAPERVKLQRARGRARLSAKVVGGRTRIDELYQDGCAKVRLPRVHGADGTWGALEAVLLNTAGGLTGGDLFEAEIAAAAGSAVTVTTQACERVYRSADGVAQVQNRLSVEAGARVHWLPQETILFDGGRIARSLDVELAADARFLAVEPLVLGRVASGEQLGDGLFKDSWRVRRAGRLVYADEMRLDGPVDDMAARAAVLAGHAAAATVLYAADDAEDLIEPARRILTASTGGASAFDGLLVCRLAAADSYELRTLLVPLLTLLAGGPLPRVWHL